MQDTGGKARAPSTVDTFNRHGVGAKGGAVVILRSPGVLGRTDALMFAAYIVAIAETLEPHDGPTFAEALEAVRGT